MRDYGTPIRLASSLVCAAVGLFLTALAMAQPVALTVGEQQSCDFDDLQAAIDFVVLMDAPETVPVRVNRNVEIANPPLVVRGASVALEGGYFDCDSDTRAGNSDLSARDENRVLVVGAALTDPDRASEVILRHIQVLGGRAFNGAGIQISGGSEVILEDSNVIDNEATLRGGGIEVLEGSTLLVRDGSRVSANLAGRRGRSGMGAGIYCKVGGDGARGTVVLQGDVEIFGNQAVRDGPERARGGGLYLAACDLKMVGNVKVLSNRATDGGGASLDHESRAQLLMDLQRQTAPRLQDNRVTGEGGALHIIRSSNVSVERADFIGNRATNVAGNGSGGALSLVLSGAFQIQSPPDVPSGCPDGPLCTRFVGNQADSGALVRMAGSSLPLTFHSAVIAENAAADESLIKVSGFRPKVKLVGNFIVQNSVGSILSNTNAGDPVGVAEAEIIFRHNTVADNPGLQSVLHLVEEENENRLMHVSDNLLMESDVPLLTGSSQFREEIWGCHVGSSGQSLPFDREIIVEDPDFGDPPSLDYHLGPGSEAIDVCDSDGLGLDIDGEPRSVDHPARPGDFHTDAGADEVRVLVDEVFSDVFER